ncbi:MAG: phosphodiester glycosidase family protein [Candidatus Cryptobacteroides sp.]
MKRFLIFMVAATVASCGCSSKSSLIPDWPWEEDDGVQEEIEPKEEWTDVTSNYPSLPEGITVINCNYCLSRPASVFLAIADLSKVDLDLWCIDDRDMAGSSEPFRTPSEVRSDGNYPVVINAGFFYADGGKYYSASLAVRDGVQLAHNINYASQDWKTIYYPTRAAFVKNSDGSFTACWSYYNNSEATTWLYPSPAQNKWGDSPQKTPSASYPEGAVKMETDFAIGGGPVLVKDGKVVDSFVAELFNGSTGISPDSAQPRTAVGYMPEGKIMFLVCEGRQMTEGVAGFTTAEVAQIMKNHGCTEAINLDGGGSSCMLVGGAETIKVSDGKQRAVASTLMFR